MIWVTVWVDTVTSYGLGQPVALSLEDTIKATNFTPAELSKKKNKHDIIIIYL